MLFDIYSELDFLTELKILFDSNHFFILQELMSQLNVWNFDIFNLDILTGGKCLMLHVAGSATWPALLLNI